MRRHEWILNLIVVLIAFIMMLVLVGCSSDRSKAMTVCTELFEVQKNESLPEVVLNNRRYARFDGIQHSIAMDCRVLVRLNHELQTNKSLRRNSRLRDQANKRIDQLSRNVLRLEHNMVANHLNAISRSRQH